MILIWSGEGGPLQWLCLIIFCLQFFAPQLIQLSDDLRNLNGSTSSYSQYPFDVEHFPFHWVAACLLVVGAAMWIFMEFCQRQQQQQQQVGDDEESTLPPPSPATLPPPSSVASLILANDVSSSSVSSKSGSGGGANIWDSVTSLFYGPGHQPHPQALPQPRPQLQSYRQPEQLPKEVEPSLDIHEHPMCEEVKSFDKNCLRRVSTTTNTSRREDEEKDDEGLSGSNCSDGNDDVNEIDCSADMPSTATVAATTDDAIVAHTISSNDASDLPFELESQDDIDDEAQSLNHDCKASAFDGETSEDNCCHGREEPSSTSDDALNTGEDLVSEEQIDIRSIGSAASEEEGKGNIAGDGSFTDKSQVIDADNIEKINTEVVSVYKESSDKEAGDVIEQTSLSKQCKTTDIESDTPSGLTSSETLLDDDTEVNNSGNFAKIDRYDTELEDPSHDDDAIADFYTAKEPKDDDESLEQACMRSENADGEKIECNPENTCIVQAGGEDGKDDVLEDDAIADVYTAKEPKDDGGSSEQACMRSGDADGEKIERNPENTCIIQACGEVVQDDVLETEMYEMAGFESSYIGMVSLSNFEPERNVNHDTHTQLEYDKPNFEQKRVSQLP